MKDTRTLLLASIYRPPSQRAFKLAILNNIETANTEVKTLRIVRFSYKDIDLRDTFLTASL